MPIRYGMTLLSKLTQRLIAGARALVKPFRRRLMDAAAASLVSMYRVTALCSSPMPEDARARCKPKLTIEMRRIDLNSPSTLPVLLLDVLPIPEILFLTEDKPFPRRSPAEMSALYRADVLDRLFALLLSAWLFCRTLSAISSAFFPD